jgi:predicted GIY-YIG superfamily endonuclease
MNDITHPDSALVELERLKKWCAIHAVEDAVGSIHSLTEQIQVRIDDIENELEELAERERLLKQERSEYRAGYNFRRFTEDLGLTWDEFFDVLQRNLHQLSNRDRLEISQELFQTAGFEPGRQQKFCRITGLSLSTINAIEMKLVSIPNALADMDHREQIEREFNLFDIVQMYRGPFPVTDYYVPEFGHMVYFLFNNESGLIYIGRTSNLRQRLKSHWNTKQEHGLYHWMAVEFQTKQEMAQTEMRLIREKKPRLNIIGNPDNYEIFGEQE